jgi:dihydropyrimidinase
MNRAGTTVLVRGGTVVSAEGMYAADVLVRSQSVAAVGRDLDVSADKEIDARGCLVLPGGIDAHTHMDFAPGAFRTSDTFTSGTAAAALGGTTCILDFALQQPGRPLVAGLEDRLLDLRRHPPLTDVGLHLIVRERPDGDLEGQIREVLAAGACDFKLYLAHRAVMIDDEFAYELMRLFAKLGVMPLVHAENGHVVHSRREHLAAEGRTLPRHHAESRPVPVELDAVVRVIQMCRMTGSEAYLVHLSSAEAVSAVARARAAGVRVHGETCMQYLTMDESDLGADDAWQIIFSPPPRGVQDRAALWAGLASGAVATVASDHSPYLKAEKGAGLHADFRTVPNGIAGVQERLPLLYEQGVVSGRLSWPRLVDVFSATPARLFGLPSKGAIVPGADADIVVFDPTQRVTLGVDWSESLSDFSAYEGITCSGSPKDVLVRGHVVVRDGALSRAAGVGRFVPRSRRNPANEGVNRDA